MEGGSVVYRDGSVLEQVPDENNILAHSCICKGAWKVGISRQLAERFPDALDAFVKHCSSLKEVELIGTCHMSGGIASLFTSVGYGKEADLPDDIVEFTRLAAEAMLAELSPGVTIHSSRLNADHLRVSWAATEAALNSTLSRTGHTWVVWSLGKHCSGPVTEEDMADSSRSTTERAAEEERAVGEETSGKEELEPDVRTDPLLEASHLRSRLRPQRISWGGTTEYSRGDNGYDDDGGEVEWSLRLKGEYPRLQDLPLSPQLVKKRDSLDVYKDKEAKSVSGCKPPIPEPGSPSL